MSLYLLFQLHKKSLDIMGKYVFKLIFIGSLPASRQQRLYVVKVVEREMFRFARIILLIIIVISYFLMEFLSIHIHFQSINLDSNLNSENLIYQQTIILRTLVSNPMIPVYS